MPVTRTRSTTAPAPSSPSRGTVDLTFPFPPRAPPSFPLTSRNRVPRNRTASSRATSSRRSSPGINAVGRNVNSNHLELTDPGEISVPREPGVPVMQPTLDEIRDSHVGIHVADLQQDEHGPSSSTQSSVYSSAIERRNMMGVSTSSNCDSGQEVHRHEREHSLPPIESFPYFPVSPSQGGDITEEFGGESRASTPPQTQTQTQSQTPIDLTQDTESTPSPSTAKLLPSTTSPQLLSTSKPFDSSFSAQISGSAPLSQYTCPICFSPPTNATLTPCGHVCCGACLFTAVKSTLQRGAFMGGGMGPGNLPRCPVCRAPIPGWDGTGGGVIGLRPKAVFLL